MDHQQHNHHGGGYNHQDHHAHMIVDFRRRFWVSMAFAYRKMIRNMFWPSATRLSPSPRLQLGLRHVAGGGAALMSVSTVVVAINAKLLSRWKIGDDEENN